MEHLAFPYLHLYPVYFAKTFSQTTHCKSIIIQGQELLLYNRDENGYKTKIGDFGRNSATFHTFLVKGGLILTKLSIVSKTKSLIFRGSALKSHPCYKFNHLRFPPLLSCFSNCSAVKVPCILSQFSLNTEYALISFRLRFLVDVVK